MLVKQTDYDHDAHVLMQLAKYLVALMHYCQRNAVSYPLAMLVFTRLLNGSEIQDISVPCKKAKGGVCHIGVEDHIGGIDSTLADIDIALEALGFELDYKEDIEEPNPGPATYEI